MINRKEHKGDLLILEGHLLQEEGSCAQHVVGGNVR